MGLDDLFVVLGVVVLEMDAPLVEQFEVLDRSAGQLAHQKHEFYGFGDALLGACGVVVCFVGLQFLVQFGELLHQQPHYLFSEVVPASLQLHKFVLAVFPGDASPLARQLPQQLLPLLDAVLDLLAEQGGAEVPSQCFRLDGDSREREAVASAAQGFDHAVLLEDVFFEHEEAEPFVALELDGPRIGLVGIVDKQINEAQSYLMLLHISQQAAQVLFNFDTVSLCARLLPSSVLPQLLWARLCW